MTPTPFSPDSADAFYSRGEQNLNNLEYDAAIADFSAAIRLKPAFAEAYRLRGWAYVAKCKYDQAINDFNDLIRLRPGLAEAYCERGLAYTAKGQYDQAITDCSYAISLNELQEQAYYNRGMAYQLKGSNSAAIVDFSKAIRIKPDYAQAYFDRGWSYTARHQFDEAINDFNEVIRLRPEHAEAYCLRGLAYLGKREYSLASVDCAEAIRLKPGCVHADDLRKRIAIASESRSYSSQGATMTVQEAEHIVFDIITVALEDKSHRYAPVSALKGYNLHEICVAQKLIIANQFLGLAHMDNSMEEFEKHLKTTAAWLMQILMFFVPDDQIDVIGATRAFDLQDPQFLLEETPESFGVYCKAVGADDPLFWQKIYTRLGLEYNEKSPKLNLPVTHDFQRTDQYLSLSDTGCSTILACFVMPGIGLVVWLFC
jgi:tetratricopeptide (TPR) repeat protein